MSDSTPIAADLEERRGRLSSSRWLLLLLWVGGYVITSSVFQDAIMEYFLLTLVSAIACCLLLTRLRHVSSRLLPFWLLLAVFVVAYYLKFYWMALDPQVFPSYRDLVASLAWSPTVLLRTYATITYGFVAFCVTTWLLLGVKANTPLQDQTAFLGQPVDAACQSVATMLLVFAPLLLAGTAYIMYTAGIGIASAPSVRLPFRLAGIIFYTHTALIPNLLLLLIWCSDRTSLRRQFALGLILMILAGLNDFLLRSSRGSLVSPFIGLGLLFLVSRRLTKRRMSLILSAVLLTVVIWPAITSYRYARRTGSQELLEMFSESITSELGNSSVVATLSNNIQTVLARIKGADALLVLVGVGGRPLGSHVWSILGRGEITRFFTVDVMGYSPYAIQGGAPSLLGWLYLVGGNVLAILGMAGFVFLAWVVWKSLTRLKLRCLPVAQVVFLRLLLSASIEGTLDLPLPIGVAIASIGLSEWLVRMAEHNARSRSIVSGISALADHGPVVRGPSTLKQERL